MPSFVYLRDPPSHREDNGQFVQCCAPHDSNLKTNCPPTTEDHISSHVDYDSFVSGAEEELALQLL